MSEWKSNANSLYKITVSEYLMGAEGGNNLFTLIPLEDYLFPFCPIFSF